MVILDGEKTGLNMVLSVMDKGKGIVATTGVGYQEVLGVAALMVKQGDKNGLAEAIQYLAAGNNAAVNQNDLRLHGLDIGVRTPGNQA